MNWKLTILAALAAAQFFVAAWFAPALAEGAQAPDKPILLMTPRELFGDTNLRKLAVAAQLGDVKKIDALIAAGVDVNGKGKYGITPLFSAAQAGSKTGFKALLERGADPNTVWTTGDTFMNLIAGVKDASFLTLALSHGGNPNLVAPRTGETPIFHAVTPDGKGNLSLLIGAGADINYQSPSLAETPMMKAAILGQYDAVYKLLMAGAYYRIKDRFGDDIRDIIVQRRVGGSSEPYKWQSRVIAFLKQHGYWMRITPPTNFRPDTFSVPEGGRYTLSWSVVLNAKTYELLLNGKIKQVDIVRDEVELRASASNANELGRVDWRVRACDDKGSSIWSHDIAIQITEYETPASSVSGKTSTSNSPTQAGSGLTRLAPIKKLGCLPADKLTNKLTPLELDFGAFECLRQGNDANALSMITLAGVYSRYDSLRVVDKTAHGVNSEIMGMLYSAISGEKGKSLYRKALKVANDPKRLGALCKWAEGIGPPDYYPAYMVQHGMDAFMGFKTPGGLVPGFNAREAWAESLTSYLHCPDVSDATVKAPPPLHGSETLVFRKWSEGEFASTHNPSCVGADELNNKYSPADLYVSVEDCMKKGEVAKATFVFLMASTYVDFDTRRVADTTAHHAGIAMISLLKKHLSKDQFKALGKNFAATIKTPNKLARECGRLEKIGSPDYYPAYMVQFGVRAFTGFEHPRDLVSEFDPRSAWMKSLTEFLRCPTVGGSKGLSKGGR